MPLFLQCSQELLDSQVFLNNGRVRRINLLTKAGSHLKRLLSYVILKQNLYDIEHVHLSVLGSSHTKKNFNLAILAEE